MAPKSELLTTILYCLLGYGQSQRVEDRETVGEEQKEGERSGERKRWKGTGNRERERDGEREMKERRNKGRKRFPSSL